MLSVHVTEDNNLPLTAALWRISAATPRGPLQGPLTLSGGERRTRHGITRIVVELVDSANVWTLQYMPPEALSSYQDFAAAIENKTGCSLADSPEDWHRWKRRFLEGRR